MYESLLYEHLFTSYSTFSFQLYLAVISVHTIQLLKRINSIKLISERKTFVNPHVYKQINQQGL